MLLTNYITSAWRNILRHKLFSAINILGLAIGLAAVMLIALYVRYETSYDSFWKNADNIYRVHTLLSLPGQPPNNILSTSYPMIQTMAREFTEIDKTAGLSFTQGIIKINNQSFHEAFSFADSGIFEIFDFTLLAGSLENALNDPDTMVISNKFAKKHFPDKSPIGEILPASILSVNKDYTIIAVIDDVPKNSNHVINTLVPLDIENWDRFTSYFRTNTQGFFTLKEGVSIDTINARLDDMVNRNFPDMPMQNATTKKSDIVSLSTMKQNEFHLNAEGNHPVAPVGKATVIIFSSVSVIILMVATINFINLSTARASRRAKEVSLRKISGASRKQLIQQFLGESSFLSFIAFLIAVAIVEISLPFYNEMIGRDLSLDYSVENLLSMVLLVITIGLAAGLYPAFILSKFHPAKTLKSNQSSENRSSPYVRSLLVIFQFTATIVLFVSTLVIMGQMNFVKTMALGYNPNNLITIWGYKLEDLPSKIDIIQQRFNAIEGSTSVTWTSNFSPGNAYDPATYIRPEGGDETDSRLLIRREIGHDFLKTYQIPLLSGRDFERGRNEENSPFEVVKAGNAHSAGMILNEIAVKQLGFNSVEQAIGKTLYRKLGEIEDTFHVIGVIPNVNFRDLKNNTSPEFYKIDTTTPLYVTIRYNGDPTVFLDQAKMIWQEEMPENTFEYVFAQNTIAEQYTSENGKSIMFAIFSILTIFIACLGLFGLASFTSERRTKEIGIRKVFGAESWQIVKLLIWQFSKPVLIANIIAWPIAYFAMSRWLESFVYRIDDMMIIALCLIAGLTALLISWATVAGNSYAVARQNPIKALRYE